MHEKFLFFSKLGLFGLLWKRGDTDEESDDQLKDSGNPKVPPSIKKVIFRAEVSLKLIKVITKW